MSPVCLSIAGSDPSGGAGIQADLKTFHQWGVYGAAAITLLTVQNTFGVKAVHCLEPELVEDQVRAVLEDLDVPVVKTGALGTGAIAQAVSRALADWAGKLVVDPVIASKNGTALLDPVGLENARPLFARAELLMPNLDEAGILLGDRPETVEEMEAAAARLRRELGCGAVLLKGGHLASGDPVDVLCDESGIERYAGRRVATPHTHGTGCTYASAVAAALAQGIPLRQAIGSAKGWLQSAIETSPGIGQGQGAINHLAPVIRKLDLSFPTATGH